MATTSHSPRSAPARLTLALVSVALLLAALIGGFAGQASAAPAGSTAQAAASEPGDTTTTLPVDNRTQGNSITRPNEGADPQSPSDPGGWLQVSLFYLICLGIFGIAGLAWFSSRRARARQRAEGRDQLSVARASGKGMRAPSPLDRPAPASGDAS